MADISVDFCGIKFENPFVIAASPSSDSLEKVERAFQAGWGGAVLKTIEPEGKQRKLAEPNMGALDFMGRKQMAFYNYDLCTQLSLEELCDEIIYLKKNYPGKIVIASVMANTAQEWKTIVRRVEAAGADMIECSVSCPQGDASGKIPATEPELLRKFAGDIKRFLKKDTPIIVKLSPNVTDIAAVAEAAEQGGADSLCAIDTVKSFIGIEIETGRPKLHVNGQTTLGGLSGPAIKPIALGCIVQIVKRVHIPVAGVGGISNFEDAIEFMMLGCPIVEICTAISRYGYQMIDKLCTGLNDYLDRKGYSNVSEIVGMALPSIVSQAELSREWRAVNSIDREKCKKCGACVTACQDCGFGALTKDDNSRICLDRDKCLGCGVCKTVCPFGCIEIVGGCL